MLHRTVMFSLCSDTLRTLHRSSASVPDVVPRRSRSTVLYVAFLRAINTGKRRIKMVDLRSLYEEMGYRDVATHIATGNVVFEADATPLSVDLESRFHERFGFTSEVFLRSGNEVQSIIESVPWNGEDDLVEVSFLEREPHPAVARALEVTAVGPEDLAVIRREVFFLRGLGKGVDTIHKESTSMRMLEMKMTRRGVATVVQLNAKYIVPRP